MIAKNARFWIWWNNDWCKLTLQPGQSASMFHGGLTDEGFSCEQNTYRYEDGAVHREINIWGRDCDGRHEWYSESHCVVDALKDCEADEYGPARPDWVRGKGRQYDQYAELAGY